MSGCWTWSHTSLLGFVARRRSELDLASLHVAILNVGLGKQTFERCNGEGGREVTLQFNCLALVLLVLKRMAIYLYCLAMERSVVDGARQYLHISLVVFGSQSHASFRDWLI